MSVWVYTFAWNEEKMLPFFFRHYFDWLGAERITVFDNESTDRTAEICDADPRVKRDVYKTGNKHAELDAMVGIRDECWKQARGKADFVVIVDCDEFVYHNDMPAFLGEVLLSRTSIARATGYDMVSQAFPAPGVHLPYVVRTGIQTPTYSKPCLLLPDRVKHVSFAAGAHNARVNSNGYLPLASAGLRLLHYPRLGWPFYVERMMARKERANARDSAHGLLVHYQRPEAAMRAEFDHVALNAVDCVT